MLPIKTVTKEPDKNQGFNSYYMKGFDRML